MKMLIADIEIGARFRGFHQGTADIIAASFKSEGQFTPVLVYQKRLIAGRHRYEAAKLCGWTHIDAKPLEFTGLNPKQIEVELKLIEIAENLMRGGLDQADTARHVDGYAQGINERVHLAKLEKEREAKEAADRAHAAALAKVKAEKDAAEKARLQAELEEAAKVREAARLRELRAEEARTRLALANAKAVPGRLAQGVVDEVVKATGLTAGVVRNTQNFVRALGRDTLDVIAGTKMATQAEMQGLIGLKKEDQKAFEKCVESARHAKKHGTGSVHSPSGMLGEIVKARKAAQLEADFKTTAGQLKEVLKHVTAMQHSAEEMRKFWYRLPSALKAKSSNFDQLTPMLNGWATLFRAAVKPIEQKRQGNEEHRYPDELPKQSKDEVRKSLGKDAKSIRAKLKSKKPA